MPLCEGDKYRQLEEEYKRMAREDRAAQAQDPPDNNTHYSQKPHHAARSVANDPHKSSPRRRGL